MLLQHYTVAKINEMFSSSIRMDIHQQQSQWDNSFKFIIFFVNYELSNFNVGELQITPTTY